MRVISGVAKGKKIIYSTDKKTRPLKDRVRESIFNILDHSNLIEKKLTNCNILDLFSGVGSFGLEAISRGAKRVNFFESYQPSLDILEKNLESLNFQNYAQIYKKDIYDLDSFKNFDKKFDLIFIDPPFKDKDIKNLLNNIFKNKIFYLKTLVIIHRHTKMNDNFDKNFKIVREEIYGVSKVIFGIFIS